MYVNFEFIHCQKMYIESFLVHFTLNPKGNNSERGKY